MFNHSAYAEDFQNDDRYLLILGVEKGQRFEREDARSEE